VCSSLKGKFYQLYGTLNKYLFLFLCEILTSLNIEFCFFLHAVKGEVDPNVCKDFLTNFEDCQLWSKNADEQAAV